MSFQNISCFPLCLGVLSGKAEEESLALISETRQFTAVKKSKSDSATGFCIVKKASTCILRSLTGQSMMGSAANIHKALPQRGRLVFFREFVGGVAPIWGAEVGCSGARVGDGMDQKGKPPFQQRCFPSEHFGVLHRKICWMYNSLCSAGHEKKKKKRL